MSKIQVLIIESELGWGQRVDEVKEFDTHEEADAFVAKFNEPNNLPTAPDWYMRAEKVKSGAFVDHLKAGSSP